LEDNPNATVVLLDYGSQDDLQSYLWTTHRADIDAGRLVVYSYPTTGPFRMAHAKNMAHRCGVLEGADVLLNLDADNYAGYRFDLWLEENYARNRFFWARMIKGILPRGISGRIAVPTDMFIKAGGYDERFNTWGHDDKDFNQRLCRMGYEAREIPQQFLDGVRHTDKMRFREYPHVLTDKGEDEFEDVSAVEATVVNGGNFGCGAVYRNLSLRAVQSDMLPHAAPLSRRILAPIPIRIFGIGMHKTGTTSLHSALKLLGYDSAHWPSAHWAKAVWMEMVTLGHSVTLERHYAATDLPIPLLYLSLDAAYPGSKFILTTRDETKWLDSVRRHWGHETNPWRQAWDTDPFTHRVHRELYGRKSFDAEVFLARYRRHNAEVLQYFSGRPCDLLVLPLENDERWLWGQLCEFLNQPVPAVPFPHRNVSG
jgi:hypothetical protein